MASQYTQLLFQPVSAEQSDMLIAALTDTGFEGFEEQENILKAFIDSTLFNETAVQQLAQQLNVDYTTTIIEETNWNAVWESNFDPVLVEDFVAIRAHFHEPAKGVEHEIIITPKMSFGTGHHATTYMMMLQMRKIDFSGKPVFDFGTGTGVLAILAQKLGAAHIIASDNDDWSIENAAENITRNVPPLIELRKEDTAQMQQSFDIILANINKNVILENLPVLVQQLVPKGILLLSGLLVQDENDIVAACTQLGLYVDNKMEKDNWLSIRLSA